MLKKKHVNGDNANGVGIDLFHFIRSIQRLEGNPDCFGKSQGFCDRMDCTWRKYCLDGFPMDVDIHKGGYGEKKRNFSP